MADLLNAYEVLNIAQTIEKNGAEFYREAARHFAQNRDVSFLQSLAATEDSHRETFAAMQRQLSPESVSDAELFSSIDVYLKAVSDSADLEGSEYASYLLTGDEDLADIVLIGLDLEKETILYYLGLRDLFSRKSDLDIIDSIIAEEKKHVVTLAEEYRKLQTDQ